MSAEGEALPPNPQVEAVAEWCEAQYSEEEKAAGRQIKLVIVVLIIGIFLLLVLPRLIDEIDYFWRSNSVPAKVVLKAKATQNDIETNEQEMRKEFKDARKRRDVIEAKLKGVELKYKEVGGNLRSELSRPYMIFEKHKSKDKTPKWTMQDVIRSRSGSFLGVGFEGTSEDETRMVSLNSTDGVSWKASLISSEFGELRGSLHSVLQTLEGHFIAVGVEKLSNGSEVVAILRSADGMTWSPLLLNQDHDRPRGRIVSLTQTRNGRLVAAGFERGDDKEEALLLVYSSDGLAWTFYRPKENHNRLLGRLHSLIEIGNETVLAAGFEYIEEEERAIVLRSTNGESWTAVRPEEDGKRLRGQIRSLMRAQDGTVLAGGFEYFDEQAEGSIVLRSSDGLSWTVIRPEDDGKRLRGRLDALWQVKDGGFLALVPNIYSSWKIESAKYTKFFSGLQRSMVGTISKTTGIGGMKIAFPSMLKFNVLSGPILLYSQNGTSWNKRQLYNSQWKGASRANKILDDRRDTIILTDDKGFRLRGMPNDKAIQTRNKILSDLEIPSGIAIAGNVGPALFVRKQDRERIKKIKADLKQQEEFVTIAEASLNRQAKAKIAFQEVSDTLDQALRKAEPVRETGQIATRVAIVGLLIYLVQILVNRYRYHQRLAKFYRARAQALRMLSTASDGDNIFQNMTFSDVANSLSPDQMGFEKVPDPPGMAVRSNPNDALQR